MTIFGLSKRQKTARGLCFVLAMLIGHSPFAWSYSDFSQYTTIQQPTIQQSLSYNLPGSRPASWQPVITVPPQSGNQPSQQNSLWPGSVSYNRIGEGWMEYYLQPNLRLGIRFTNRFTFQLQSKSAAAHQAKVPDGWYLMQMAVVLQKNTTPMFFNAIGIKGEPEPYDRFVTSRSMFIEVSGGLASRKVTLDIPYLSATTVMNHLLVELTPLQVTCKSPKEKTSHPCLSVLPNGEPDPSKSEVLPLAGYQPYLVDVNFVPVLSSSQSQSGPEAAPPIPTDDKNLTQYILHAQLFQAEKSRKRPSPPSPAEFARRQKLTVLSVNDPIFPPVRKHGLNSETAAQVLGKILDLKGIGTLDLTEELGRVLPAVCYALAMQNPEYLDSVGGLGPYSSLRTNLGAYMRICATRPGQFLRMARITHVYQFDAKNAEPGFTKPLTLQVQTNFMVSRSYSADVARDTPNPITAFFRLADSFGLPLTALGFGYSVKENSDRSKSDSASGALALSMNFNMIGMHIPLLKYQRCLEVRPVAGAGNGIFFNSRTTAATNGLYICAQPSTTPLASSEVYGHAVVHSGDAGTIDSYSPMAQSVNVTLQGDRDISAFWYQARKNMTADHNSQIQPFQMMESAQKVYANVPSSDRNLIVNPIQFAHDDAFSFLNKQFGAYTERFVDDN